MMPGPKDVEHQVFDLRAESDYSDRNGWKGRRMFSRHGVGTIAFRARGRAPSAGPTGGRQRGPMNICVVALGKIGLPLAVQFARSGHSVLGADISAPTVDQVNAGVVPFPGEADLDEYLAEVVAAVS